jgi:hypothetical protein
MGWCGISPVACSSMKNHQRTNGGHGSPTLTTTWPIGRKDSSAYATHTLPGSRCLSWARQYRSRGIFGCVGR